MRDGAFGERRNGHKLEATCSLPLTSCAVMNVLRRYGSARGWGKLHIRPAVNVGLIVSRVGSAAQVDCLRHLGSLRIYRRKTCRLLSKTNFTKCLFKTTCHLCLPEI